MTVSGSIFFVLFVSSLLTLCDGGKIPNFIESLYSVPRIQRYEANSRGDLVYELYRWNSTNNQASKCLKIIFNGSSTSYPLVSKGFPGAPVFSSDEKILYFLSSDKSGIRQVWGIQVPSKAPFAEPTPFQVTNSLISIDLYMLFKRDGSDYLLYTMKVDGDCKYDIACTAKKEKERSKLTNRHRIFTELYTQHWDKWVTARESHVFVQKIDKVGATLTTQPLDLMKNYVRGNTPVPPFGGLDHIDVSPDGKEVAFTVELIQPSVAWTTGWRIFIAPTDGSSPPKSISEFTEARTETPKYSPDGKKLFFLSMTNPGHEADKLTVTFYDRISQEITKWTSDVDISFSSMTFDHSGKLLIAEADYFGRRTFFGIPIVGDEPPKRVNLLEFNENATNMRIKRIPKTNQYIFMKSSYSTPPEIFRFSVNLEGDSVRASVSRPVQLTDETAQFRNSVKLSKIIRFSFLGAKRDRVYGWLIPPLNNDWQEGKKAPFVHLIHGGPQSSFTNSWKTNWSPYVYANEGYGVLIIDFHGSVGYGQEFSDSIRDNWSTHPYFDILKGTMVALKAFPWLDATHAGALGGSYGGYMVNWIQGHTKFFKALVSHDGIFDIESMYYSTDELWFFEWEMKGQPWTNPESYKKHNPVNSVTQWATPEMVIHGGHDFRVPLSQGIATFTALQRRGIPSKFLEFDVEGHIVGENTNAVLWYKEVLSFLDEHIMRSFKASQSVFPESVQTKLVKK